MKCTHINEAKTQISILIDSGAIYKETKHLTKEKIKKFMEKRWTNPEEWELDQISEKQRIIDEEMLKEKLKEIRTILSKCNCLEKEIQEKELKEKLGSKRIEVDSKSKNLAKLIRKLSEEGNNCGKEVFKLQKTYKLLEDYKKDSNKSEVKKTMEEITDISGSLFEKGIDFDDIEEISKICEEIAKLKIEINSEEQKQQEYQAMIEFPTNN